MENVFDYLYAVGAHWLFTFGGIAVLLFLLYEKYERQETSPKIFWGIAVLLLCVGFYQAWLDEHHNAATVIAEKAVLSASNNTLEARVEEKDIQLSRNESEIEWLREHQSIEIKEPDKKTHSHMDLMVTGGLNANPYWPLHVNQNIEMNVGYANVGESLVSVYSTGAQISWLDIDIKNPRKWSADIRKWVDSIATQDTVSPQDVIPHSGIASYATIPGPTVTLDDIAKFNTVTKGLCSAYKVQWKDETGCYETQTALCVLAQDTPPGFNWHEGEKEEHRVSCKR
jgi:hypothetical protein